MRQIWTLYVHEVRSALRERSIVAMSIIVPIVMYPALLWAAFAGFSFIEGQSERLTSRVAIHGLPAAHQALADSLGAEARGRRLIVSEWPGTPEEARAAVDRGRLDAFVAFAPAGTGGGPSVDSEALPDNFRLVVQYSEARDRSRRARSQIEDGVAAYRAAWIEEWRAELGLAHPVWVDFSFVRADQSTAEEGVRFLLALLVPFLTLIMVALAAYYPAIDATAGERERTTWETLMTVAAPRRNVAAAKYLYVATFGAVGGLLNLGALALALRWIVSPVAGSEELGASGIPLSALPMIAVGTALLGLLVAAGMLVFAVFARNFKEGQSMITPFYLAMVMPALFVQSPDIELTPVLALVPVVNVALLIREAIMGSVPLLAGAVTLASMAVTVGLAVSFAQWIMSKEEVLLGGSGGGLAKFLKRSFRSRRGNA